MVWPVEDTSLASCFPLQRRARSRNDAAQYTGHGVLFYGTPAGAAAVISLDFLPLLHHLPPPNPSNTTHIPPTHTAERLSLHHRY